MSWKSGSKYMKKFISRSNGNVPPEAYKVLIDLFNELDCDTLYECVGLDTNFDIAFNPTHPYWMAQSSNG